MTKRILIISICLLTLASVAYADNYALNFDGTDDYVTIPDNDALDLTTTYTIEAWIKPRSFNWLGGIVGKYQYGATNGYSLSLAYDSPYSGIRFDYMTTANGILTLDKWQHIAAVNNGGTRKVYLNGVEQTLSASLTVYTVVANSDPVIIGKDFLVEAVNRYFNGEIDEVRIWNTARSEAEIKANMYKEIATPIPTNLKAYYKMSDGGGISLADNSGNNNTGTITNGATWKASGAFAGPRKALDFDGLNDYVTIPNNAQLSFTNTSNYTIEAWIKPRAFNFLGGIVGKYHTEASNGYTFRLSGSGNYSGIHFDGMETADGTLTADKWQHIAAVNSGGTRKVYLNGVEQPLTGTAYIVNANSDPVVIGKDYLLETGTRHFNGEIDEVRIWNVARSADQIRENMMNTLNGSEANLAAYYRMDQSDGTTLYDMTANANNGTLTNMDNADWVSSTAFNTWIGSESSVWAAVGNWSRNSAPASTDNVGIYKLNPSSYEANISGTPTVNSLYFSSGATPTLSSAFTVNGNLLLGKNLDMNGNTITLGSSGTLVEGSYRLLGSGNITTTRNLSSITAQNAAGLGAVLTTSANMGSTVINRAHTAQTISGNPSILRYYDITPTTNTGLNATLVFNYNDSELNGLTETDLKLWKSIDGGTNWSNLGGTINTTDNTITLTGQAGFSRWSAAVPPAAAIYNTTISTAASSNGSWSGGNPDTWTPSGTGSNVSATEIETKLNAGTSVVITTGSGAGESGDITISNPITKTSGAAATLTLQAFRNIVVSSPIAGSSTFPLNVILSARGFAGAVETTLGDVEINANIKTYGGDITIGGGDAAASGYAVASGVLYSVAGVNVDSGVLIDARKNSNNSIIIDATSDGSGLVNTTLPVTASGGNITIRGKGNINSATNINWGFGIFNSLIATGGTGTISIDGVGGLSDGNYYAVSSAGVAIEGNSYIKSNSGNIAITGTAGTGYDRYGIASTGGTTNNFIGTNGTLTLSGDSLLIRDGTLKVQGGSAGIDINAPIVGCQTGNGCAASTLVASGAGTLRLYGNAQAWIQPTNTSATSTNNSFTASTNSVTPQVITLGQALYAFGTGTIGYTVTYNGNGNTGGTVPSSQTKTHDVALTLATNSGSLAKTGSTFAGWNTASDGSGTDYAEGATYTANAAITLYAKWTAAASYTVTYDANGATRGSAPNQQTKTHGVALTLATNSGNLAKTGFGFAGWNTQSDGLGTNYAAGGSYTANAPITLYAKWTSYVLNNGKLKFGSGENSINDTGNLQVPFYYSNVLNYEGWKQLTLGAPLNLSIALNGDAINEWNLNGDRLDDPALIGQVIDTSGFTPADGYGTVISTGTLIFGVSPNTKTIEVKNTYELLQGKSYATVTTRIKNISGVGVSVSNVRYWVGTRDDYVGNTDAPRKQKGNLVDGNFVQITNVEDRSLAIKISTASEGVLFYTNSDKANTIINGCCSFINVINTNPQSSTIDATGDGSYGFYVRLNDLDDGASDEFTWYYAAGTIADLANIINDVASASSAVSDITHESAKLTATSDVNGTGYWIVVAKDATAPTDAQIAAAATYSGVTIVASGSEAMTANVAKEFLITTGLQPATNYDLHFVIKDGSNVYSAISKSTFTTKLISPTGVTATAGNQSAIVSWTASGGATSYQVTGSPSGTCTATAPATICTVTGLTNGTAYTFTVTASNGNSAATSVASSQSNSVTPTNNPDPPTGVTLRAGDLRIKASWTAPVNTGGLLVSGYTATANPGGLQCTTSGSPADTSCTINGLTNGTPYTVTVTAATANGTSSPSTASSPATPLAGTENFNFIGRSGRVRWNSGYTGKLTNGTPDTFPNGIYNSATYTVLDSIFTSADVNSNASAQANCTSSWLWSQLLCDPGAGMDSLTQIYKSNQNAGITFANSASTDSGYIIIDLQTVRNFTTLRVFQMFSDGKVTDVKMSVSTATLDTWPTYNDGSWSVIVPKSPVGSGTQGASNVTCPSIFDFGAKSGRYILLEFWNAGQFGSPGYIELGGVKLFFENEVTLAGGSCSPEPPTNASATAGAAMATVTWTPPAGTITGYSIQYSSNNGASWATATTSPSPISGAANSAMVTNLSNGISYVFRVSAANSGGSSPYSSMTSPVTTSADALNPPTNVTATAGNESAVVSWTAEGGGGAATYQVTGSPSGSCTATAPATTCTVTGLTNGLTYTFTVIGSNATKTSPVSNTSNAVTPPGSVVSYTVTGTARSWSGGGTVSPATQPVDQGDTATLTITPSTGSSISTVTGCGGALSGNTYTTGAINADCEVIGTFTRNSYTVTASAGAGGNIAPATRTVAHDGITTFTITPDWGYDASVSGCGGNYTSGATTYTTGAITSNCNISATFTPKTYTVTAIATANGKINGGSQATEIVTHGGTTSFTITSNTGYTINYVLGCNGSLSGDTYTTGLITGDCKIMAFFKTQ